MKAAVLTAYREPLQVMDLPDPAPGPHDAILRVAGCGICRSDWHLWQHDWTWIGLELRLPHVLGHEVAGEVVETGAEVKQFKPGDRVTLPFHMACGGCGYCHSGRSNLCGRVGIIGASFSGGYGSHVCIPLADVNLVRLPDGVDFAAAAALGCRFMTSWHGLVDVARVRPGEWVAVFGMGGVGLAAVQIANAIGARPIAVSNSPDKLEQAKAEGALAAISAKDGNVAEQIRDLSGGGATVTVDALGASATTLPAISALARGGRHVQLGLTGQEDKGVIGLPVDAMVFGETSFHGSSGCPTTSYPEMLALVADGRLDPKRLVSRIVGVDGASAVLESMGDYSTRGFAIITHDA